MQAQLYEAHNIIGHIQYFNRPTKYLPSKYKGHQIATSNIGRYTQL